MQLIKYLVLALVLGYTAEWVPVNLLLATLGHDRPPITIVKNEALTQLIQNKTGVKINAIKISESDRPFGLMIGIPGSPQLILSRHLNENFSPSEMEYVVLHEAGHYRLNHSLKELLLGLILLFIGIRLCRSIPAAVFLGLIFGIGVIQLGKLHELQADQYSLDRTSDPQGMITATEKFSRYYGPKYSENVNPVWQWLFYRGNPYDNRIKMAEEKLLEYGNE